MVSPHKGKAIDQSSAWSDYTWDTRGFYIRNRYGPTGEIEYGYSYGETVTDQRAPRTPAPIADPDSQGSPDQNDVNNYRPDAVPSYTLSTTSIDTTFTSPPPTHDSGYASVSPALRQASQAVWSSGTFLNASYVPSSYPVASSSAPYNQSPTGSSYRPTTHGDSSTLAEGFGGMGINTTVPDRDYPGESSNAVTLRQVPKHISKAPNTRSYEDLDPRYKVVEDKDLKKFWRIGRVFMMLWTEPARTQLVPRGGGTRNGSHFSTTYLRGTAYSEIRRFVVIGEGHGSTICSPIHTYSGQATLKPNLPEQQQHAIIHTSKNPPPEKWYYADATNETIVKENLNKDPIRVIREQDDAEGDLGHLSRLNYSKIYTVENYVRVLNIGRVHQNSMESLIENAFVKQRTEPPQKPRNHTSSGSKGKNQRSSGKHKEEF